MAEIYVKVVPGASDFKVEEGYYPVIYLEEKAKNGRANKELVARLKDILDEDIGIVEGSKSRRKKLRTSLSKNEFEKRLYEK